MPLILILVKISMWTQTLNFKLNINPYLIQFKLQHSQFYQHKPFTTQI